MKRGISPAHVVGIIEPTRASLGNQSVANGPNPVQVVRLVVLYSASPPGNAIDCLSCRGIIGLIHGYGF